MKCLLIFNELICTSYQIRTDTFASANRSALNALPYLNSCFVRCFCKFYSLTSVLLTTSSNHSVVTKQRSFTTALPFELKRLLMIPHYNPRYSEANYFYDFFFLITLQIFYTNTQSFCAVKIILIYFCFSSSFYLAFSP